MLINQNHLSRPLLKRGDEFIDLSTDPELEIVAIF